MQRVSGRRVILAAFAFVLAFVLAGCLAPPPQDNSGDASGPSPEVTTDSSTGSSNLVDAGPIEDATVDAPGTTDAPNVADGPGDGSACGPANCPTGCCDSNGVCALGNTAAACGQGGAMCATCAIGQACNNQACSCGGAGCACGSCSPGQHCNTSGKCVCDSTSCSGCCDSSGKCQTSSIATCGVNAAACVACSFGNAAAICNSGTCALSMCNAGFANCDGVASNGCETNVKGTDASNCGACTHSCLTGGSCSGGVCQPIPFVNSGTSNIVDLDTNGTIVVFADSGKLQIAEVDIPGGTPQVLAGNGQVTNPDHVAIDPSSAAIYWTDSGNYGTATAGQVGSGSIQGDACGASKVNAVANPTTNALDILSTNVSTLLVGVGCVADTTTGISGNLGASLSPRWVFGDIGNGVVVFGGAQGPPSATIANQPGVNWVADDKTYGYWATTEPAIRRAPFNAPSSLSVVLASPGGAVGGLATDGTYVYYGTSSGIFYVPVGGASSGTLLTNKPGTHIRYASKALFFLAGGVIYKIATPP